MIEFKGRLKRKWLGLPRQTKEVKNLESYDTETNDHGKNAGNSVSLGVGNAGSKG